MSDAPDRARHGERPTPSAPLRVVFVCGGYRPSEDGVSAYVRRLTRALHERVQPIIITAAEAENATTGTLVAPVEDWQPHDVRTALLAARAQAPDVLHVQYAPVAFKWRDAPGEIPLLARGVTPGIPVMVTAHEFEPDDIRLLESADASVVTTTEHARRILHAQPQLELQHIPIGPNVEPATGDPRQLAASARARWNLPEAVPLVVFFGFLHPVKGLEYLIRAMHAVPRARLVLVGGWRSLALPGEEGDVYRERLLVLADRLGLAGRVQLTGYLPDDQVSALLHAADVVALPFTYGISFKSGSLLAAMAHGRPIVATQPTVVEPGLRPEVEIVWVPPRDADALAQALRCVLDSGPLQRQLASNARRAAATFSWESIAAQHVALYERLAR